MQQVRPARLAPAQLANPSAPSRLRAACAPRLQRPRSRSAASMATRVVDAATVADFERLTAAGAVVCHFWAPWCEPCGAMDAVLAHLATAHAQAAFVRVEAEALSDVSEKHGVPSVPFFLFFKARTTRQRPPACDSQALTSAQGGAVVDRLEGADAAALNAKTAALCGAAQAPLPPAAAQPDINTRLAALVHSAPVMLFMKGSPDEPKCGFSRKVVEALRGAGCSVFGHFDILSDTAVREGLKTYSNWPTYPQLYVRGELMGGCDIVLEMAGNGELKATLDKAAAAPAPAATDSVDTRIRALLASAPVMLFMKGSPAEPKCGFSRKVVEAIRATDVPFSSFDILGDEAIRAGLKEFSNWPTYPQLYVRGELVGGCDIVLEMASSGELKAALSPGA